MLTIAIKTQIIANKNNLLIFNTKKQQTRIKKIVLFSKNIINFKKKTQLNFKMLHFTQKQYLL